MILDLSILPKRHPARVAAAKRIRAIRFEDHWQRNRRRIRAASVWTKRFAVVCMQSGELFDCPALAARRFRTHPNSIRRCAESGINLYGKMAQFIWLNGVRWYEKNVWNSTGSVGCVETGKLFLSCSEASRAIGHGIHYQDISWSARFGAGVQGLHFVWLDIAKRRRAGAAREKRKEAA